LSEEITKKQGVLDDNKDAIIDLKKKLAHYKSTGTKLPGAFVIKFKEFQDLQKHIMSIQKELQQHEDMLGLLLAKANEYQSNIMEAKIINHDVYKGHNEIRFKLLDPDLELYLVPTGGINEKCFMLHRDEDTGEYKIVGSEHI
jgi:RecJ-like exonuclease